MYFRKYVCVCMLEDSEQHDFHKCHRSIIGRSPIHKYYTVTVTLPEDWKWPFPAVKLHILTGITLRGPDQFLNLFHVHCKKFLVSSHQPQLPLHLLNSRFPSLPLNISKSLPHASSFVSVNRVWLSLPINTRLPPMWPGFNSQTQRQVGWVPWFSSLHRDVFLREHSVWFSLLLSLPTYM